MTGAGRAVGGPVAAIVWRNTTAGLFLVVGALSASVAARSGQASGTQRVEPAPQPTQEGPQSVTQEDESVKRLRQAADQGDVNALYSLGVTYAKGAGVAQDIVQAVQWWRKAAEAGNPSAQSILGVAYGTGTGVAQDDAQAVQWWSKAAEQGVADAQYSLGLMYVNGRGVAQVEKSG